MNNIVQLRVPNKILCTIIEEQSFVLFFVKKCHLWKKNAKIMQSKLESLKNLKTC